MTTAPYAHPEDSPLTTSSASVDRWLSRLRSVKPENVSAWVNDAWRVLAGVPPSSWSASDVDLAVSLIRPARVELAEFVEAEDLRRGDWAPFLDGSKPIVGDGLTMPDVWFSISMALDDEGTSAHWSWTAIELRRDRALLCERSDSYGSPAFPHPFGVITHDQMFRSAALLMARRLERRDYFTAPRFLNEIHASGIPDDEVYRILASASGHGGDALIHSATPRDFRTADMRYGFDDLAQRLNAWCDPSSR